MDTNETKKISYALAKQVPDMSRGFLIHTSYGDISLDGEDAEVLAGMVKVMLERRLAVCLQSAEL